MRSLEPKRHPPFWRVPLSFTSRSMAHPLFGRVPLYQRCTVPSTETFTFAGSFPRSPSPSGPMLKAMPLTYECEGDFG